MPVSKLRPWGEGGRMPAGEDAINRRIGERLQKWREEHSKTKEECAQLARVARSQWARFENGTNRIRASTLARFAANAKVPVSYFLKDVV